MREREGHTSSIFNSEVKLKEKHYEGSLISDFQTSNILHAASFCGHKRKGKKHLIPAAIFMKLPTIVVWLIHTDLRNKLN